MSVPRRRQLEALFPSALGHGFITTDPNGFITAWSRGAERLLGYGSQEVLGQPFGLIFTHEDRQQAIPDSEMSRALYHGIAEDRRWHVRKDGSRVYVNGSTYALRSPDGDLLGFAKVIQDDTLRKRLTQQLQLERNQAQEHARLKSELLAQLSHELRSPLSGLLGLLELVPEGERSGEEQELFRLIGQNCRNVLRLLENVLDLSKLEEGRMELERVEFSVRDCLNDVVAPEALKVEARDLEVGVLVEPEVPELVQGDPVRLRQILLNLVNNALKFTPSGKVVIRAAVDQVQAPFVTLRFSVSDTGIGIAPERQKLLFQPYTQAEPSVASAFGGTGLGLFIAARLVEAMQGRISLRSKPGEGTTVWFTAELRMAPAQARTLEVLGEFREETIGCLVSSPLAREAIDKILVPWKLKVRHFTEPEELARALGESADDYLLILDRDVFEAEGLTEALSGSRVLLLTSLKESVDPLPAGVAAALWMPITQSRLLDALGRAAGATTPLLRETSTRLPAAERALRILLAEDNRVNRETMRRVLERMGHQVWVAEDGAVALQKWKSQPFDIVFLDLQMPVMDGLEVIHAIRERERMEQARRTPVVALTGHGEERRAMALSAGLDDYLVKPVDAETLADFLEKLSTP